MRSHPRYPRYSIIMLGHPSALLCVITSDCPHYQVNYPLHKEYISSSCKSLFSFSLLIGVTLKLFNVFMFAFSHTVCKAFLDFCKAESLIMTRFKTCLCRFSHSHNSFFIVQITGQKCFDHYLQLLAYIAYHLVKVKRRLYSR